MKMKCLALGLALCSIFISYSQEPNAPEFGKGLFNLMGKDSTWSAKIATRMQFLSSTTWTENANGNYTDPDFNALIRRARLKFDGFVYSPKLSYKLELGLSNRDISGGSKYTSDAPRYILDAVVMWNFYQNFELWVGQTKLPGNVERVISSGNLQLVDRSLLNGQFTLDRDMGIQLRHYSYLTDTFLIREIVSISQGEGRNVTTGNLGGHQYSGRLELLPFGEFQGGGEYSGSDLKREKSPKLMLAATYNLNLNAVKTRGSQGTYMETDYGFHKTNINTLFLDAVFKYNGFSFMGEYAHRDAQDPFARNIDGSLTGEVVQVGHGLNLQTGYLFNSNWEISGRYTNVELNKNITGENPENQYTLGLSKYIVGHKLKVQTDISYLSVENGMDAMMYRLQLDVHF
ncbi:OprO/OprP family phosphate-selective porin [Arenibacter algicola]|uniref:porin n=1 Tax=Arenibacter algicola TaxID=616991 RepID=UPI001C06927D|nr:porin [Arenibacter algicola]MBU2905071.1 OprO/OprP family phosphate-selective porin [Arenibacter algicola]